MFALLIFCVLDTCQAVSDAASPHATGAACHAHVEAMTPVATLQARVLSRQIGAPVRVRGWCGTLAQARQITPAAYPAHNADPEV